MAGLYPDVPDHRMSLDKDGTQMFSIIGGVPAQLSAANVISVNDETAGGPQLWGQSGSGYFFILFPEKRDVTAYFMQSTYNTDNMTAAQVSTDTTNGVNGTWTSIATRAFNPTMTPNYRTQLTSITGAGGIVGMRFLVSSGAPSGGFFVSAHVYGTITAGQNPDRLALWHPTLDAQVGAAYFDWGDAQRGSTADRTFRVKNLSPTLSANAVTCSTDALTDTSPTVVSQHTLSADATTFAATASAGTLAPGTISGVMTLRRTISNTATLSLWALRVNAAAASWS